VTADESSKFPGSFDTVGSNGSGFRLTDYISTTFLSDYDYFRVDKVEYMATISNMPKENPNILVFSAIDYDSATITSWDAFWAIPNKALTNLTATRPTQQLLTFAPRRRISSNADPSLQVITKPKEWLDSAYANQYIFGNVKVGVVCPDGQQQYPSPSTPASILVWSTVTVTFRGRIGV